MVGTGAPPSAMYRLEAAADEGYAVQPRPIPNAGRDTNATLLSTHDETLYRQIVESAHEGIWVADAAGSTTYVNRRMAEMLEDDASNILARSLYEFVPADVREEAIRQFQTGRTNASAQLETRLTTRMGRDVWVLMNISALHNADGDFMGILAMVVDISERHAAQEQLRRSERRLKTIIDAEPACVKLVCPDGLLLDMNRAGLGILGVDDLSQVVGQPVVQLVHPDDRERYLDMHRAASQGASRRLEFRVIGVRGGQRWVDAHAVPFDDTTMDVHPRSAVLSVTSDVTERKLLEEQLRQAQRLEAVGRLAGGVAHDFNNLLTAILGFCDLAASHLAASDPAHQDLAEIKDAGERAVALTQQLLAFGRKQVLRPRVLDLNQAVSGLLRLLPRLIGEDINISAELDPHLLSVKADPSQLEQVLLNLAVNAREAMPVGGSLRIATRNTRLHEPPHAAARDFEPGPYVVLSVTDTGIGMDENTRRQVFEPFFTTKRPGAGLGLSMVYGIVKQSRGFIIADSQVGHGTTFTVYLPATTAPPQELPRPRSASAAGGCETILLVEDAPAVRQFVRRTLERQGYLVVEASSAKEAVAIAGRGLRVDLLLTTVITPDMSGPELADQLVRTNPQLRVLYMSGYGEEIVAARSVQEQPPVLQKPVSASQLAQCVRQALDTSDWREQTRSGS